MMIKYTIKATGILPDGTSKPIEVVIKSNYPETHAMLKGKVWDMVDTDYVVLYIDEVEEDMVDDSSYD